MEHATTEALNRLLDLPLWSIGRAGSLEWFQFGSKRMVSTLLGGTKEVGEFALHLDCPWRLTNAVGNSVASDESASEVLATTASPPITCCGAVVESPGRFSLSFSSGEQLRVEAEVEDCVEYWRLFRPGEQEPHFVVGPAGVERQ